MDVTDLVEMVICFLGGIMLTLVSIVRRLDYPFRSDRGPQDLL